MAWCTLLHELRKHAGFVGVLPGRFHQGEHAIAHGPSVPYRNDLLLLNAATLIVDLVRDLLPCIEDGEVLHAVTAQFREGRHGFGSGTTLAHDQLARSDEQLLVFKNVLQETCAVDRHRQSPRLLVELRHQMRSLQGQPGYRGKTLLAQTCNTLIHAILPPMLRYRRLQTPAGYFPWFHRRRLQFGQLIRSSEPPVLV